MNTVAEDRAEWVEWIQRYGIGEFYDAFMRNAQNAIGTCKYCDEDIVLDMREGGGVPDWRTRRGDCGCDESLETTDEGCGSHMPYTDGGEEERQRELIARAEGSDNGGRTFQR